MTYRWLLLTLALAACSPDVDGNLPDGRDPVISEPPVVADPRTPKPDGSDVATIPVLRRCVGRPFTPDAKEKWLKWTSPVIALGRPRHAARDEIVAEGAPVTIKSKFAYGSISKDLEQEKVRLFIDDCTAWKPLGDLTTNGDGRAERALGVLPVGVYEVRFEVMGDQSLAPATIWVLPKGTHLAVFDIDGTLTSGDGEVIHQYFSDIFFDDYVPEAYPFATELTQAHEALGYVPVYVTGRPYWLSFHTRRWLADGQFAAAPLRLADTNGQVLPTESGVGTYKLDFLKGLVAAGFVVDLAYGNATTDIYAYLGAGVDAARVWIIGKNAGQQGTHAVTGSWEARVGEVDELPVEQPFQN